MGELREALVCYVPGYRRAPLLFVVTIIVVFVMGAAVAADDAVPGDVLFPLDQGLEWVHHASARTPQERGEFAVDRAHERALELSRIRSMTAEAGESRGNEALATELVSSAMTDAQELVNELRNTFRAADAPIPEWLIREEQRLTLLRNRLEGVVPQDVEKSSATTESSGIRQYLGN